MNESTKYDVSRLKRAVDELSVLNDIATAVNVTMSVEKISQVIVERCTRQLAASQGAIFLLETEDPSRGDFKTYVRTIDSSVSELPFHLNEWLKGWMVRNRTILVCNRPGADPRFDRTDFEEQGIFSILAVPLLGRDELIGLLVVFNARKHKGFTNEDGRFLAIVGTQAAKVLENARLFEREAKFIQQVHHQRMTTMAGLVAGVAHEFNNPVGAITGSIDTLGRAIEKLRDNLEHEVGEEIWPSTPIQQPLKALYDALQTAKSGSSRVSEIVQRLRSFARLDQAEFQRVDIRDGLEECLALLKPRISRRIRIEKQFGDLPEITCYPAQLNQAFLNILLNAIQAIPGEGTIEISTSCCDEDIQVVISDSGIGIPQENLSKVLDPGFTTRGVGVGTGLGLPISYQIIQIHQGRLDVVSTEKEGTSVTIKLPINLQPMG